VKAEPTNRRAIRIVSQCASAEEFLAVFHPYLERDALFIATGSPEEPGAELRFVMTLASGEPMMTGGAVVLESHRDRSNFYGLRGMKVRFDELDEGSRRTLQRLERGPSRRAASSPGIGAVRRAAEVVECLIFEEPGNEAAEPVPETRSMMDSMSGEPEARPLGVDDDVTAVAPPPQPPRAEATLRDIEPQGPATIRDRASRFIVPAPKSDPAIQAGAARPPDFATTDPQVAAPADSVAAPVTAAGDGASLPQGTPRAGDGNGAAAAAPPPASTPTTPTPTPAPGPRARPRGKGTASTERPATPVPVEIGPGPSLPVEVFELGPIQPRGGAAPLAQQPTMRLTPAPQGRGDAPAPSERTMAAHAAIGMPTPTEIVSPLALRSRTSKPPLVSEPTQLVRVGHVRTAAVSATLGALLGLGAGYLLWGLPHEGRPLGAPLDAAAPGAGPATPPAPAPAPVPEPSLTRDAGPAAASPGGEAPDALRVQRALRVVSTPPGAEVLINKKHAGVTPFELPLEDPKAMTVTLRKSGFKPWTKVLRGDETDTTFEVVMRRAPPVRRR
jgi:hypothetical protein